MMIRKKTHQDFDGSSYFEEEGNSSDEFCKAEGGDEDILEPKQKRDFQFGKSLSFGVKPDEAASADSEQILTSLEALNGETSVRSVSDGGATTDVGEGKGEDDGGRVEVDEDPLDAFMVTINQELRKQEDSRALRDYAGLTAAKPEHEQFELQDPVDTFERFYSTRSKPNSDTPSLKFNKPNATPLIPVKFTKATGSLSDNGDSDGEGDNDTANSDDEVYSMARDAETSNSQSSREHSKPLKLDPVDHSNITYSKIPTPSYVEAEEISNFKHQEVVSLKASMGIQATGLNVPRPIETFLQLRRSIDSDLFGRLKKKDFLAPTPIQAQTLPAALSGRDCIGLAETGSGKTIAFLVPVMQHTLSCMTEENRHDANNTTTDSPIALIVAPTRELAEQLFKDFTYFAKKLSVRVGLFSGGYNKTDQFKDLRRGIDVAVVTPGRVIDLARMKDGFRFHRVSILVLDEADKMFSLGFESQIRTICQAIRPDRQTCLFSATMPPHIERLARDVMSNVVRVTVGRLGQAAEAIDQVAVVLESEDDKWKWIESNIRSLERNGQVLIFCNSQLRAAELKVRIQKHLTALSENLSDSDSTLRQQKRHVHHGEVVKCIHGDLDQTERILVMNAFRRGNVKIMVATDVASRGLDIASINTVVNYDVAKNIETHTHRIGRTGRAGRGGSAITLLMKSERRMSAFLAESLEALQKPVPRELLEIAMTFGPFKHSKLSGEKMRLKTQSFAEAGNSSGSGGRPGSKSDGGAGLGYNLPFGRGTEEAQTCQFPLQPVDSGISTVETGDSTQVPRKKRRRWDSSKPDKLVCESGIDSASNMKGAARALGFTHGGSMECGEHYSCIEGATGNVYRASDALSSSSESDNDGCGGMGGMGGVSGKRRGGSLRSSPSRRKWRMPNGESKVNDELEEKRKRRRELLAESAAKVAASIQLRNAAESNNGTAS